MILSTNLTRFNPSTLGNCHATDVPTETVTAGGLKILLGVRFLLSLWNPCIWAQQLLPCNITTNFNQKWDVLSTVNCLNQGTACCSLSALLVTEKSCLKYSCRVLFCRDSIITSSYIFSWLLHRVDSPHFYNILGNYFQSSMFLHLRMCCVQGRWAIPKNSFLHVHLYYNLKVPTIFYITLVISTLDGRLQISWVTLTKGKTLQFSKVRFVLPASSTR